MPPGVIPGQLVVLPRFDGRQVPAKAAWVGKLQSGQNSDAMATKIPFGAATCLAMAKNPITGRVVTISIAGASYYSDDEGNSWTAGGALPTGTNWDKIICVNGLFIAFNADGTNNGCATSPTGAVWTARTVSAGYWSAAAANSDGSVILAFEYAGAYRMVKSTDGGQTWSAPSQPISPSAGIFQMAYFAPAGLFVVAANATGQLYTSPDGSIWTLRASAIPLGSVCGIAVNSSKVVIAFTPSGVSQVCFAYSADCVNWSWEYGSLPSGYGNNGSNCLTFDNNLFVYGSQGGLYTSNDAVNWRLGAVFGPVNGGSQSNIANVIAGRTRWLCNVMQATSTTIQLTDPTLQDLYYVPQV